jgi:hypothetical protein
MRKIRNYQIRILEDSKKVVCTTELEGKIVDIPMADLKTELPSNVTVSATSPIEAIRKYWRGLQVETRPAKLQVGKNTYFIDWAGWNECGCGRTGWFVMLNEKEYEHMRDDHGNALFELPDTRLLMVEE